MQIKPRDTKRPGMKLGCCLPSFCLFHYRCHVRGEGWGGFHRTVSRGSLSYNPSMVMSATKQLIAQISAKINTEVKVHLPFFMITFYLGLLLHRTGQLGERLSKFCPITSCLFTATSHICEQWQQLPFMRPAWLLSKGRVNSPTVCGETWMVYCAFDLTWKELIDFYVTGSVREKKKKRMMLAGHFTTCAEISEREKEREGGRGWRERSPHTRLHSYSITIIWLTWAGRRVAQRERGEESRCVGEGKGIPALGDHSSYL